MEAWSLTFSVLALIVGFAIAFFFILLTPFGYITSLGGVVTVLSIFVCGIVFASLIVRLPRLLSRGLRRE